MVIVLFCERSLDYSVLLRVNADDDESRRPFGDD
jgi:hypothetical protein